MLSEIRNAAREARQMGFLATAEAMEMFADTHIEVTGELLAMGGELEQAVKNQENELEESQCGASAKYCCGAVRRVRKCG